MNKDLHEIFKLAAKHFFKKYRDKGGSQAKLAQKLEVTQPYISSVLTGNKNASLDLQSQIASILYHGPYEEFLAIGRRIQNGLDPEIHLKKDVDDSVESLITRLSHYVVDHQRIEGELVSMRDFYESILKMLPSGVMVYSAQHFAIYVNPKMVDYIGIPEEKVLGVNFYQASEESPGRNLSAVTPYYKKALETLEPVYYENIKVVTSGGNKKIMTGWMVPQVKDNKFNGMICTVIDTTEQNRLEQQVVDEKDKISSILEHIFSGIVLFNAEGYVTYANQAAERRAEITFEEFKKFNVFEDYKDMFPKADYDQLLKIIKRVFKTGEAEFFDGLDTLNPKGNPGARTGWVIPIKRHNDKISGVAVSIRDDEEINLIKRKIAHLNESLLATLDYAGYPVAIALQEKEGGPVISFHMNREAEELTGINQYAFDKSDINKANINFASLMKNGDKWLEFTQKNFMGRESAEMTIHMKDGRKFIWESKSLRNQEGVYYGRIVHIKEKK